MNLIMIKKVCVLVFFVSWGQVRSQYDVLPTLGRRPGASPVAIQQPVPSRAVWFVNGPTEISVEAEEQRSGGIGRFVNGPTGISVEAEQQSRGQPPRFVNGPTGISVEAEQQSRGQPPRFVNGPTGISVEAEEQVSNQAPSFVGKSAGISHPTDEHQPDEVTYDIINNTGSPVTGEQEQTRSSSRGVFSPDPGDDRLKEQLPPGLHIDTADWSKDSVYWSFKGGDWSLVDLPDPAHPALPAPVLPGPALLVVTQEFLKKVYIQREVRGLTNVTLHYRFFLSQGDGPHGVPELKVYQVTDKSQLLVSEMARGSWLDRTLHLPGPVPFTIVFEGRLSKEGNEIALDDVTISGISEGEVGHGERELLQDDIPELHDLNATTKTTTANEGAVVSFTGPGQIQEISPKNATKLSDEILKKTDNVSSKTEVKTLSRNNTTETPIDAAQVTSTAGVDVAAENSPEIKTNATEMHISSEDRESPEQVQTTTVDSSDVIQTTIESITEASELIHEDNDKEAHNFTADGELNMKENDTISTVGEKIIGETEEADYNSSSNTGKIGEENESVQNTTEDLEAKVGDSETSTLISTTTSDLPSGRDITEELRETTLTYNDANESEDTTSINVNSQPTTDFSQNQRTSQETLSINTTTFSPPINTEPSVYLQTSQRNSKATVDVPRGTQSPKSTSDISRASQPTTGFRGTITPWGYPSKSTTMQPSYIPPSGDMTSASPEVSEEMHVSNASWGIFQFFLALCLVGLIALGFLYWRKKRRQDDEIPVFTRSSYADYHNPTFTPEDDANFPSRGPRHNYKSFE
ncbi:uncharacterized protein [Procambarus clarkii]|uniref:uncharacterized protein isoform X2 n=1 Tax=Procambarus clarkii TaxID=6728 RepID=UPI001E673BDB|nr:uncharacterized protein LOC123750535 isoform X2 [Procambarus clarkii]